jgi:brefeldin A-inhibited guanine nucleotide-exchange protein
MLNTDAHNPVVKHRMTKNDFIKNNRGINDGNDLPEEFLSSIYDEIVNNEIRMKDELDAALGQVTASGPGIAGALVSVGRGLQREAYMLQSNGMADKTEVSRAAFLTDGVTHTHRQALFKTLMRSASAKVQKRATISIARRTSSMSVPCLGWLGYPCWLAFLAGPLQQTDDMEVVELCLDGFEHAIRIMYFFDLKLERNAFVTTLAKFTFLNNLGEMKAKNMEAIKALLDVAINEGNNLKGS